MASDQAQQQGQVQQTLTSQSNEKPASNMKTGVGVLGGYELGEFFDEMFCTDGTPRAQCQQLAERLAELPVDELVRRQRAADRSMIQLGITFNVYGDAEGTERVIPFDTVPRIMPGGEWVRIEQGLRQRIRALNMFIDDIYHESANRERGGDPRACHSIGCHVQTPMCWLESARGCLVSHHGYGFDSRCGWNDVRAGGQSPLSIGRILCPAESNVDEADVSSVI
jgi:hypothetical protein